jgi:hypothetical protein
MDLKHFSIDKKLKNSMSSASLIGTHQNTNAEPFDDVRGGSPRGHEGLNLNNKPNNQ